MPIKKEIVKTVSVFICDFCSFEGTEKETANHETLKHKIKIIPLYEDTKLYWFGDISEYKLYCRSISAPFNPTPGDALPGWLISWENYATQFIPAEIFLKNLIADIKEHEEILADLKEKETKIKKCLQKN